MPSFLCLCRTLNSKDSHTVPDRNWPGLPSLPPSPPATTDSSIDSITWPPNNLIAVARTSSSHFPAVQYTDNGALKKVIDRTDGDIVVVLGVCFHGYVRIMTNRELDPMRYRVRSYSTTTGILQLALLTPLHEHLHVQLRRQIVKAVVDAPRAWARALGFPPEESPGSPRLYWSDIPSPGLRQGHYVLEADTSASHVKYCRDHGGSLIILMGVSQVMAELRQHMMTWLRAPGLDKHVLLVKACRDTRSILIENWSRQSLTNAQAMLCPDQSVSIWPKDNGFTVSGGPLELGFRTLFQRDPMCWQGDVVMVDEEMLNEYATFVWDQVDNGPAEMHTRRKQCS